MSTLSAAPSFSRPSPGVDQRKSVRVTLPKGGIPVVCQRGSRVLLSKANALGARGAFVFTTSPFPLGSSFILEFGGVHKICVQARVRCTIPSLGMGVQFLTLSDEFNFLVHQWLSSQT